MSDAETKKQKPAAWWENASLTKVVSNVFRNPGIVLRQIGVALDSASAPAFSTQEEFPQLDPDEVSKLQIEAQAGAAYEALIRKGEFETIPLEIIKAFATKGNSSALAYLAECANGSILARQIIDEIEAPR